MKSIILNSYEVVSILNDRMTEKRILMKPQPPQEAFIQKRASDMFMWKVDMCDKDIKPLYRPGDVLYVRETVWQKVGHYLDVDGETKPSWYNEFRYVATDDEPEVGWNYSWAKRSSVQMPKEAARIFLRVKNIDVKRLQDMWASDTSKNGLRFNRPYTAEEMIMEYAHLWDSTIKKSHLDSSGWKANPWVWAVEFERCEKPSDSLYSWNDAINKLVGGKYE